MRLPPIGTQQWAELVAQARASGYGPGGAPVGSRPEGRAHALDEIPPVVPTNGMEGPPGPPAGLPVDWKPQTTTEPIRRFLWGPNQLETVRWGGNATLQRPQGAPLVRTGDIFRAEAPYPLVWFPLFVCRNQNALNGAPPGVVIELTVGSGDGSASIDIFLSAGPGSFTGGFPIPAKWIQARARSVEPLDPLGDDYSVFASAGLIY